MAERLHDDFERIERINLVGSLFLEKGYSTRTLSKILSKDTKEGFLISNATVSTYINKYKDMHPEFAEQIDCLIEANKGSSIKNPAVIKRVLKASELVLKNYSIDDIYKSFNESYWVIYYDIHIRLPKIDPDLYNQVLAALEEHARAHNVR
jgi:transposase